MPTPTKTRKCRGIVPSSDESSSDSDVPSVGSTPTKRARVPLKQKGVSPPKHRRPESPHIEPGSSVTKSESDDGSIVIPMRHSRLVRTHSGIRRAVLPPRSPLSEQLKEQDEEETAEEVEEDIAFQKAMHTPTKRRGMMLPESPYIEPFVPVAESTKLASTGTKPKQRRRKLLTTPSTTGARAIQRAVSPAVARAQIGPESAWKVRRRTPSPSPSRSSSIASYSGDTQDGSVLDETIQLVDWESDSDEHDIVMDMEGIQFKNKGKEFELLKPINSHGLYHHIVHDYQQYKMYINKWISSYKDDNLEAICAILQLFIDVMGLQDLCVKDFYKKLEEQDFKTKVHPVVKKINTISDNLTGTQYLWAFNLQWSKGVRNAFHTFFDRFLVQCHIASILYPVTMQLNYFLKDILRSNKIYATHTATSIVLITMNAFVDLVIGIMLKNPDNYRSKMFDWLNNMVLYYFYEFIGKDKLTGDLSDKRLKSLRFEVAYFLKFWLKRLPALFLKDEGIYDLLKELLMDREAVVRKEAMNCCKNILSKSVDKQYVDAKQLKVLIFVVIDRIQDVDLIVASSAIQCHTKAIERFHNLVWIPTLVSSKSMLAEQFIIRKEAFLNFCVTIKLLHLSNTEFLCKITQAIHTLNSNEKETFILFLVEAVYKMVPELSNLQLILDAVDSELKETEYASYLLKIFCNSAQIQYVGYLDAIGDKAAPVTETPNLELQKSITKIVIENTAALLDRFDEFDGKCLLQTLNCLSVNDLQCREITQFMEELPPLLLAYFNAYTNGDILVEITKFFASCLTADGELKQYFERSVNDLCRCGRTFPHAYIFDIDEHPSAHKENVSINTQLLEKLHSLIISINVKKYSKLAWKHLYTNWNNSRAIYSNSITTLQMQCCRHYLIWQLKEIISDEYSDDNFNDEIKHLKEHSIQYINTLVRSLTNKKLKTVVQDTAFECIGYIFIDFKEVINAAPEEYRREYRDKLSLDILPIKSSAAFVTFVANKIEVELTKKSKDAAASDQIRQYISFVLKLFLYGAMDLAQAHIVMKYFNNDLYCSYGDLFVKFLDQLAVDHVVMTKLICHTIKQVYISSKTSQLLQPGQINIKYLTDSFNAFNQYMRNNRRSCGGLLCWAVKYALYENATELLPLFEPMLERLTNTENLKVKKIYDDCARNKTDPKVKKFILQLNTLLKKD